MVAAAGTGPASSQAWGRTGGLATEWSNPLAKHTLRWPTWRGGAQALSVADRVRSSGIR